MSRVWFDADNSRLAQINPTYEKVPTSNNTVSAVIVFCLKTALAPHRTACVDLRVLSSTVVLCVVQYVVQHVWFS